MQTERLTWTLGPQDDDDLPGLLKGSLGDGGESDSSDSVYSELEAEEEEEEEPDSDADAHAQILFGGDDEDDSARLEASH